MLIKNTVLWPFVRGCGTVFLCGKDGRDWKGEEVWMDGRQRPETAGDSAVVFKTIQSAPLASKRSSAYEDLRVKAFLNALVAVGT